MSLGSVFLTSSAFFRWKAYNEIVKETFLVLAALQVIERYNSLQSGSVDERTTVSVQRFLTASVAMPPSLFPFLTAVNLIVSRVLNLTATKVSERTQVRGLTQGH